MAFLAARVGLSGGEGWIYKAICPDGREALIDDIDISTCSTGSVDVASVLATLVLSLKTWSPAPGIPLHPSCISPSPSCYSSASDETWVESEDEGGIDSFAKVAPVRYSSGHSTNPGCGCTSETISDCPWKDQAMKVQAEASKDKARNGALVQDLRRRLVRMEAEAEFLRQSLRGLEAEGGLKDIYIHTLLAAKEEAEAQVLASQGAVVAMLQDTLGEREAEIIDQQAENIALRRQIKAREERHTSVKRKMETEIAGLKGRLANLDHESRVNGPRVMALTQEKEQLERKCSSMKQTISEKDKLILGIRGCLGEQNLDLDWDLDLHIHSLSGTQKRHYDPQYQTMQNAIWERDQQIADMKDRLAEHHRALVKLANGGVESVLHACYGWQWDTTAVPPETGGPLRPSTTPV